MATFKQKFLYCFNNTHRKNCVLLSNLKKKRGASDLFPMFTQSINLYTLYCRILKNTAV